MVAGDPQEKTVNLTVPRKVHLGESFVISGNLVHSKSGVGYVELIVQTQQNGGEWENIGETVTDLDGKFEANLKAPTQKGEYKLKVSVPTHRLYLGGKFDAKTIAVDGNPTPNSDGNFLNTFYKWVPILAVVSLGIAMVGLGTYNPKNKSGGIEKKS